MFFAAPLASHCINRIPNRIVSVVFNSPDLFHVQVEDFSIGLILLCIYSSSPSFFGGGREKK